MASVSIAVAAQKAFGFRGDVDKVEFVRGGQVSRAGIDDTYLDQALSRWSYHGESLPGISCGFNLRRGDTVKFNPGALGEVFPLDRDGVSAAFRTKVRPDDSRRGADEGDLEQFP